MLELLMISNNPPTAPFQWFQLNMFKLLYFYYIHIHSDFFDLLQQNNKIYENLSF